MSRTSITFSLFTTLVSAFISSTALASGAHSGGHHADSNAIGQAGNAAKVTRTIQVDMSDSMRFTPASIKVKQGETIKFVVKNSGKIKHEMVLGTEKDLKDHYEVMKKNPEMEHEDPNMVTVQAGKTAEIEVIMAHIILIGAPIDEGQRNAGCVMGPAAYRVAGLGAAIALYLDPRQLFVFDAGGPLVSAPAPPNS